MKLLRSFSHFSLSLFCLMALAAAPALAQDWRPVDPAELALKTSVVEKDADAEALFWEVRVDDDQEGLILSHYLRIKIFTERGRESQSKVEIPFGKIFGNSIKIKDIAARTIKPDGTIVELKKDDVLEQTAVKANGLKVKVKSFAMPGIEPGAIIEYRWREVRENASANYVRLQLQRDIPVQSIKYYIKPFPYPGYGMRAETMHGRNSPFVKEKNGFYSTTMTNMPALREERLMPPEDQVRTWMLLFYTRGDEPVPEKFWRDWGRAVYEIHKSDVRVNDEVRRASQEAVGDASTPEQKLERLFNYVRAKIKNIYDDASGLTPEERAKAKVNKSPADTLKRGQGTGEDITMLFCALATASGFDARVVEMPDRSDIFFDKTFPNGYFMRLHSIAVKVGDDWRFFDPSNAYVPFGMLPWKEEGQEALILDPKEPVWVTTPISGPEKSVEKRTGKLSLSEDGTLEGDVTIEYTGHLAAEKKELNDDDSPQEREEVLRNMIKGRMSTAELSDIKIENVTDPIKPFVYSFHVRVPGYAQRTGKRLFLQPAFFEHGANPLFSASERNNEIYFHYPWSEEDRIEITLPAGFALDNPDAPAPFSAGPLSNYTVKIGVTKDEKLLVYNRKFFFGGNGGGGSTLRFPVKSYGPLKTYFDVLNKEDNHTITLKQATATASN